MSLSFWYKRIFLIILVPRLRLISFGTNSGNSAAQSATEVRAAKLEGTGLSGAARGQSPNGRLGSEP
jgi:hypothetical protein